MHDVLGVTNKTSDYSFGRLLSDSTDRGWHLAADYYGFAFILPDGTIVLADEISILSSVIVKANLIFSI